MTIIRCIGHYNTKKKILTCYSVRSANQTELLAFSNNVDKTDQSIIENFL